MTRRPALRSGRWPLATRSRALFLALLVATTGYAVLMGGVETSRLAVRGTINTNAATAAYDILVRPKDTRLPLEVSDQLVQPGFLDGLTGGITTAQWHAIEGVPGVEVAAPVALIGWTMPFVAVPIDLAPFAHITEPILLRRNTTWTYDSGASTVAQTPVFMYVTPNPVRMVFPNLQADPEDFDPAHWVETKPDGTEVRFDIAGTNPPPQTVSEGQPMLSVVSTAEIAEPRPGTRTLDVLFPFPFRLAAIDPEAEAKLSGLDRALVSGSYLTKGAQPTRIFHFSGGQSDTRTPVPVLVGDAAPARLSAAYGLEVIRGPLVDRLARRGALGPEGYDGALNRELLAAHGTPSGSGTFDSSTAYRDLLASMATPTAEGKYYARSVLRIQRTSPVDLTTGTDGSFVPKPAEDDDLGWGVSDLTGDVADSVIPPGGDDARLRKLAGYFASPALNPPALVKVGVFDALKLPGSTSLGRVPLGTFAFAPTEGADDASRDILRDSPWFPATNLTGYLDSPPLMLTTLDAAGIFADARVWSQPDYGGIVIPERPPLTDAPLSAIRVRVAGVSGVGPVDRERVRIVAEDIARLTGLDVDITMGSSPGPQRIAVPAGLHGRPAMTVTQLWVTKGVAARLMTAVDRKSLLLNWVVLAASGLVVANAVFASVRARRREIGTARAVGWTRLAVLRHVLVPVLASAVGAGLAGLVLAVVVRVLLAVTGVAGGQPSAALREIFTDADVWRTVALAPPVALGVALLAALPPAVYASRVAPLAATRAPVSRAGARVPRRVRSVTGLATRSVVAAPGRAVAGLLGVLVATAGLGALLAIQAQFHGRAVGTLLGDAVAVEVRTPDIAAVLVTAALAGVGIAHLIGTEIRERATEFAGLRAIGWTETTIARLVVTHAALVALLGAGLGAGLAWWFVDSAFGGATRPMVLAIVGAGVLAVVGAALIALIPARRLRDLGTAFVLAED